MGGVSGCSVKTGFAGKVRAQRGFASGAKGEEDLPIKEFPIQIEQDTARRQVVRAHRLVKWADQIRVAVAAGLRREA